MWFLKHNVLCSFGCMWISGRFALCTRCRFAVFCPGMLPRRGAARGARDNSLYLQLYLLASRGAQQTAPSCVYTLQLYCVFHCWLYCGLHCAPMWNPHVSLHRGVLLWAMWSPKCGAPCGDLGSIGTPFPGVRSPDLLRLQEWAISDEKGTY